MHGLHPEMGIKTVIFALILEVVFLGFCVVFIGHGLNEMKKRQNYLRNVPLVLLGFFLAAVSLYVTKLLMEG